MSGSFVDSNVLLYLAGEDAAKAEIALELLSEQLSISVQVLNEIASVMLGKFRRSWDETAEVLALVRASVVVHGMDELTHDLGLEIARRHKLQVYDGMIVAAALQAGCGILYSEDMHAGLVVEGRLTIVNPFA